MLRLPESLRFFIVVLKFRSIPTEFNIPATPRELRLPDLLLLYVKVPVVKSKALASNSTIFLKSPKPSTSQYSSYVPLGTYNVHVSLSTPSNAPCSTLGGVGI